MNKTTGRIKEIARNKKAKIGLLICAVIAAILSGYLIVKALSFVDNFTTTNYVSSVWHTQVATSSGVAELQAKTCNTISTSTWFCSATSTSICLNDLGDGDYIIVAQADSGHLAWKNDDTACSRPQCEQDGPVDGNNLVADNTVNFSDYAARAACQAIGGRLPTRNELGCLYNNSSTFGGNFAADFYWSSAEDDAADAYYVYFANGGVSSYGKTYAYYVRCVQGW